MGMSHGNMDVKMIVCASWPWLNRTHCIKSHESSQTCFCMCSTASCTMYCVQWTLHVQNRTALEKSLVKYLRRWVSERTWLMPVMGTSLRPRSVEVHALEVLERHLTTSLCARYRTEVCIYTSGTRGYAFWYVLPRYDAWGTSRLVRYIEVYVIARFTL